MSAKNDFQKSTVKPFNNNKYPLFPYVPCMALFLPIYIDKSNKWDFVLFHERSLDLQNWQNSLLESSLVPPKVN